MKLFVLVDYFLDIGNDVAGIFDTKEKACQAAKKLGLTKEDFHISTYELNKIDDDK